MVGKKPCLLLCTKKEDIKRVYAALINPIFHGPGHMWPGFFECLQLKNILSKKNYEKNHIFFASGLSPCNDAFFFTNSAKSTKNPKIQVIRDLGRGNPATLGRKNRTWHFTAPPVLTWRMQLFVTVSCVRGEGEGPWHGNCLPNT
jgi:hypothetical protein